MRRVVVPFFAVIVFMAVGLLAATPAPSAAMQPATPTPGACVEGDVAAEETVVEPGQESAEDPPEGVATLMTPAGAEVDEVLYLSVVTLPEDACLGYRQRIGAVVLFVQEGSIVYTMAANATVPNPVVKTGDSDPATDDVRNVAPGDDVTLEAGQWVSQSSPLWYTFHNPGPGEATVVVASYVLPPWEESDPCSSGCRAP